MIDSTYDLHYDITSPFEELQDLERSHIRQRKEWATQLIDSALRVHVCRLLQVIWEYKEWVQDQIDLVCREYMEDWTYAEATAVNHDLRANYQTLLELETAIRKGDALQIDDLLDEIAIQAGFSWEERTHRMDYKNFIEFITLPMEAREDAM